MFPTAFGVNLYYPVLGIAVAAQFVLLAFLLHRDGSLSRRVLLFFLTLVPLGFLGAKLASVALHGLRPLETELLAGYRYPGALLGVLGFGFVLHRWFPSGLSFARFADFWAPSFALACAVGRLGCLAMGCCYGAFCTASWALVYPRGSGPWWSHYESGAIGPAAPESLAVHPFPLYLFGMEIAVLGLCLVALKRKAYDGQVVLLFLAVHGVAKFALEFFRDPYHLLHQSVLPIAVVAAAVLVWRGLRDRGGIVRPVSSGRAEVV
ncbi:MAG: prolipoprotein diacylglyceryl transferase [Proteobacteria bacterium]|nr:prolipoprotein diacylglyceryl transferase [Pseudomonadota bacterium]